MSIVAASLGQVNIDFNQTKSDLNETFAVK